MTTLSTTYCTCTAARWSSLNQYFYYFYFISLAKATTLYLERVPSSPISAKWGKVYRFPGASSGSFSLVSRHTSWGFISRSYSTPATVQCRNNRYNGPSISSPATMSAAAEQSFANRNRCILISVSTLVNALGGVGRWFAFSLSIIYPRTIAVCFAKSLFGADEHERLRWMRWRVDCL